MARALLNLIVWGCVTCCAYRVRKTRIVKTSASEKGSVGAQSGSRDAPLDIGNVVRIFSKNYGKSCMRHQGYNLQLHVMDTNDHLLMNDSAFVVRAGLAGGSSISFESVNYPSHYIRHKSDRVIDRVKISRYESGRRFRQDASWYARAPRDPYSSTGMVSFESYNYPGKFIRHGWREIWSHSSSQGYTPTWPEDSTWKVEFANDRVATIETGALLRAASFHANATLNYTKTLSFGHTHTEETNHEFYAQVEAESEGMIQLWKTRVKAETGYTYGSARSFTFDRSYTEEIHFLAHPGTDAFVYQLFMDATTTDGKPLEWLGPVVLTGVPLPTVVRWPTDFE